MFRGQTIDNDSTKSLVDWIEACKDHPECALQRSVVSLPTRIIDLESEPPKLCNGRDAQVNSCRYVYLSHRWGDEVAPPQVLKVAHLSDYECGIDMSTLPALWRETMMIVREIGYRYLWIDALCVVQDDEEEKCKEVAAMGSYVANADMVFAPTNMSANDHLAPESLPLDMCEPFLARFEDQNDAFKIHIRQPLQTALEIMAQGVLSRCWRQQEALLPRRLVIFGREQLHWNCAHGLLSQGDAWTTPTPWTSLPNLRSMRQHRSQYLPAGVMRNNAYRYWYSLVETNSRGELTYSTDRFSSFIGLGREVSQILDHEEIEAGMLSKDMRHGLLWIHMPDSKAGRSQNYEDECYAAPSWSWLSASKPVSHGLVPGLQKAHEALQLPDVHFTVEELLVSTGRSPIRQAVVSEHHLKPGCFLRISSLALAAIAENKPSFQEFSCFFDAEDNVHTTKMENPYFVLVAPWTFSPGRSSRWAGLILCSDEHKRCIRTGVFLGPRCDEGLSLWKRQTFEIY